MSFQDKLLDSFIAFEQVIDLENPIHTDRKNSIPDKKIAVDKLKTRCRNS